MEELLVMMFLLIGGAVYFTPTIVAFVRKQPNILSIGILNFFLGWSFIGWIIALVWATKKDKPEAE